MSMRKLIAVAEIAASAAIPMAANASSITIDSVAQRWPWNNKVDITYTVTDGQNREGGVYAGIEFTIAIPGFGTQTVSGNTLAASAETGGYGSRQYTVTWTAPGGVKATDCTVTATLFPTNVPSGNDYMIIDLTTGALTYEGLMATQAESNTRYNTTEYKTTKMVLRKVPKWSDANTLPNGDTLAALGGYPTGDDVNYSTPNERVYRQPDKDYYMGIFNVTRKQYYTLCGDDGLGYGGNNVNPIRPVSKPDYIKIRSDVSATIEDYPDNPSRDAAATNRIASVGSNEGTFFQRLNYKTGLYFDFPTEVMHEIAARAGVTTTYIWGSDTTDGYEDYVSCKIDDAQGSQDVGSKVANTWGIYDMCGLCGDFCLGITRSDRRTSYDYEPRLQNIAVFAPTMNKTLNDHTHFPLKGGGSYNQTIDDSFRASDRRRYAPTSYVDYSFRVSCIVK